MAPFIFIIKRKSKREKPKAAVNPKIINEIKTYVYSMTRKEKERKKKGGEE